MWIILCPGGNERIKCKHLKVLNQEVLNTDPNWLKISTSKLYSEKNVFCHPVCPVEREIQGDFLKLCSESWTSAWNAGIEPSSWWQWRTSFITIRFKHNSRFKNSHWFMGLPQAFLILINTPLNFFVKIIRNLNAGAKWVILTILIGTNFNRYQLKSGTCPWPHLVRLGRSPRRSTEKV